MPSRAEKYLLLDPAAWHNALGGSESAGPSSILGSASITLDPFVVSSAGENPMTGVGSILLDPFTIFSGASTPIVAVGAITLDPFTVSAAGTNPITGAGSFTLDPFTLDSAASNPITGAGSFTLDPFTVSSTVAAANTGVGSITLDAFTVDSAGYQEVTGTSSLILNAFTIVSAGTVGATSISENETFWGAGSSGETVNLEAASGGVIDKDANGPMTLAIKWRIKQNTDTDPLYRHANSSYFAVTTSGDLLNKVQAPGAGNVVNRTDIFGWGLEEVHCLVFSTDGDSADLWVDGVQVYALRSIGKASPQTFKHPFAINGTWINAANGAPKDKNIFNVWVSNDYVDLSTHGAKFYGTDLAPTQDLFDGNAIAGSTPVFAESGNAAAWNLRGGLSGVVTDVT